MHQNAEKELGRRANEIGAYRGLVQDFTARQSVPTEAPQTPTTPTYDADDFHSKPVETVQGMIQNEFDKLRSEFNASQSANVEKTELELLNRDFPGWQSTSAQPEFAAYAQQDASRAEDVRRAVQENDVGAARRLLTGFQATQPPLASTIVADPVTASAPTGVQGARSVATESPGNSGSAFAPEKIYQQDAIRLKNSDPEKYAGVEYQTKLMEAIRTGNFVK